MNHHLEDLVQPLFADPEARYFEVKTYKEDAENFRLHLDSIHLFD